MSPYTQNQSFHYPLQVTKHPSLEKNKKGELQVRTAHSLNQVPFIIYDKNTKYTIKEGNFGLANVAPTIASIFGLKAPDCWEESMK